MKEQAIQSKIIKWLNSEGYFTFKTGVVYPSGIPDIIALSPSGVFVGIEVKVVGNRPTELQQYQMQRIRDNGGIAFVAHSLEEVQVALGNKRGD